MEKIVWTLWWQGEDKAPDIVKACINSMRTNIPYAKIVVLNQFNIQEYIKIPEYIIDKFKKGAITITHLSDIIRMHLLYTYGGLWLDSTVYVNKMVPEEIFSLDFFTIKSYDPKNKMFSKNRWCGFLLGAQSNSQFFKLQCELLDLYWKNEDIMIDYLLIDYFIGLVLEKDHLSKENYNKCPKFTGDILKMQKELFTDKKLGSFPTFNKLTWKNININSTNNTVYGKILKTQGIKLTKVAQGDQSKHNKIRKIRSGIKHTLTFFNLRRTKCYGVKLQFYQYINSLLRTSNSDFSYLMCSKYNELLEDYLLRYVDEILKN